MLMFIAQYPNANAFLQMISDPRYQKGGRAPSGLRFCDIALIEARRFP